MSAPSQGCDRKTRNIEVDRVESIFDLSVEEKLQLVEDLWDEVKAQIRNRHSL